MSPLPPPPPLQHPPVAAATRHPFLDDLAAGVVLTSSILRRSVAGRAAVTRIVQAGARQYAGQTPRFLGDVGGRSYFEYGFSLQDGIEGSGLVSMERNDAGEVCALAIAFSPLDAVLSMAAGLRTALAGEFDAALFL